MADWFEDSDDSERNARRESCTDSVRPEESSFFDEIRILVKVLVVRGGGCWLISNSTGLNIGMVVSLYLGVVLLMMRIKK